MEVAEQRHVGTYAHLCAQLIAESKDSGLVVLRQGEHTWEAVREHVLAQEAREHAAGVGLFPHLWERMHVYVHEAPPGPPMRQRVGARARASSGAIGVATTAARRGCKLV